MGKRSRPAPLIGISSYARAGEPEFFSLPAGYVDAVRLGGGVPIILPPGEAQPEKLLDLVDGLIIAGGGDLSPALYGGAPHESVYDVSDERDSFELDLTRAALGRADVPLLCICRGLQLLDLVCGGSLHVHLPDAFGERVVHRLPPRLPTLHPVRVEPGSRLAEILGGSELQTCSWHHQAVDRIGTDLEPVAWSADGVVEALEHTRHPWCIAVQWHPEMQLDQPQAQRLFRAFVAAAEKGLGAGGRGSG
jgi:putative glutamine amidotransferase